jgi:hypothetical protein
MTRRDGQSEHQGSRRIDEVTSPGVVQRVALPFGLVAPHLVTTAHPAGDADPTGGAGRGRRGMLPGARRQWRRSHRALRCLCTDTPNERFGVASPRAAPAGWDVRSTVRR